MPEDRGMMITLVFPNKHVHDAEAVTRAIVEDMEKLFDFIRDNPCGVHVENYPARPQDAPRPPAFDPQNGAKPKKPRDPNAKNPWAVG